MFETALLVFDGILKDSPKIILHGAWYMICFVLMLAIIFSDLVVCV